MKKRIAALFLCTVMIIGALSSCFGSSDASKTAVAEKVPNVFKSEFVSLPEKIQPNYNGVTIAGDRIYMRCYEQVSESPYHSRDILYSMDMNGENPKSETLSEYKEGIETNTYIQSLKVTEDGGRILIENSYSYNEETYESSNTYAMKKISADGTEIFSVDPQKFFPERTEEEGRYYGGFYPQYVEIDADGNIYIGGGNGDIVVVSPEGEKLFDLSVASSEGYGYIESMSSSKGRVYATYYDYDSGSGGYVCKFINTETKKFDEAIEYPEAVRANRYSYTMMMGDGYDMYFKNTSGLYGYNNGDTSLTEIINWLNSDINPNSVNSVNILSPEKLIYSGYNDVLGKYEVAFLTRTPDDEVIPKYLIRLATTGSDTYDLMNLLVQFNRSSEEYRIVLDDYSRYANEENWNYGVEVLNNDISAGKIPDMIMASSYDKLPYDSYEAKGMFVNLYDYIDADPDLSKDDLLKSIRTPFEKDGRLYRLVNGFYIRTLSAKISNVGDRMSWSISDMVELSKSLDEGVKLFEYMTKNYMLENISYMGISEFINYETNTCSFDSEAFIGLLNYINSLPNEEDIDYEAIYIDRNEDYYAPYKQDKIILNMDYISSVDSYIQTINNVFGTDQVTYIGYPGADGNGSAINANSMYSISSKSPELIRNGAWQFLKTLLSDEIQTSSRRYNFPSTYKALDALIEKEKNTYRFYYDNGRGWSSQDEPFTEERLKEMESWGETGKVIEFTQEYEDFLRNFLDSIVHKGNDDSKILEIIKEECEPFFSGSKTAEETAKVIQSKVSIYISESN